MIYWTKLFDIPKIIHIFARFFAESVLFLYVSG